MSMSQPRDYAKLHFVVLIWGFTAVLGKLIELSATQVVLYRSALAAAILFAVFPSRAAIPRRIGLMLIGNGTLIGLHWILFFLSVKIANVSICMIGMATTSFWTAILEPLIVRECRFRWINLLLGSVVFAAVYVIFQAETQFHTGLLVALIGAVVATVFSIFNGMIAGKVDEQSVVMYEMAGAAIFCSSTLAVSESLGWGFAADRWVPTAEEWLWLGLLVLAGTLFAYQMYVELLRRLSVFTINFANNLEPVYGITLGALFFGDHRYLGGQFYAGAVVILAAVLVQPFFADVDRRPDAD